MRQVTTPLWAALGLLALGLAACAGSPEPEPEPAPSPGPAAGDERASFTLDTARLFAGAFQRNIRSGRHVDLAPGPDGSVVLASFQRPAPDDAMRLLIERIDADGNSLWRHSPATPGRATSLCRLDSGDYWVCGFVEGRFDWEADELGAAASPRSFLLRLDPGGALVSARFGPPQAVPMLVRTSASGALLVVGECGQPFTWDDAALFPPGGSRTFLGRFDPDGRCRGLELLHGDVTISQAAADPLGGFVLGGRYVGHVRFGRMDRETTGTLDSDAVLLHVDAQLEPVRGFFTGAEGQLVAHTRSREGVLDLYVDGDGGVVSVQLLDSTRKGNDELVLLSPIRIPRLSEPFDRLHVGSSARPPGSVVLAAAHRGGSFVSHTRPTTDEAASELVLDEFAHDGRHLRAHVQPCSINTMFRAGLVVDDVLWLAGHFQGAVAWGPHTLENDGAHQLFVLRQPLR